MGKTLVVTKTGAVVTVGHRYNDTETTQVEVLQISHPPSVLYSGLIYVHELTIDEYEWYDPSIIGAAWVDVS